ncbi:hypothetical protein DQ04_00281190 [Trypanosoma grayi]|uniref:hypothetical protein n=1 Tax=Trypanosoma grayi TaxID=71804 RepID=UPI0004F4365C|nr:hypothetical protein DQ04_00281190 [Trypanosoma grayi]KEG14856.1 hypothetical protein DQ04_00281190 [Trypanosoma grayi]
MRRRLWVPLLSLQLATRCSSMKGGTCSHGRAGEEEAIGDEDAAAQRLVHSLGFELHEMELLVRSFTTGEKPPLIGADAKTPKVRSRLVEACTTEPLLAPTLNKLVSTIEAVHGCSDRSGHQQVVATAGDGCSKLTGILSRCAKGVETGVGTKELERLSSAQLRLAAVAVLAMALRESMQAFRREGRRRSHEARDVDPDQVKCLQVWRCGVLRAHVEAAVSLDDACRAILAAPRREQHGYAVGQRVSCVCAATIIASSLSLADELKWHVSRPSVRVHFEEEALQEQERHIARCSSSILRAAVCVLESAVEESIQTGQITEHPRQLPYTLRVVEDCLTLMETPRSPCSETTSGGVGGCLLTTLLMWVLLGVVSFRGQPSLQLEKQLITCLQRLWLRAAPPLERHSSDKMMTHRTIHASLNLRLSHCRETNDDARHPRYKGQGEQQRKQQEDNATLFVTHPAKASSFLRLLERATNAFSTWQTQRGTASPSMVMPYAILCRTMLEMETEVYFLACQKTDRTWTIPTGLHNAKPKNAEKCTVTDPEWNDVFTSASALRVSASSLVCTYTRAYISQGLSAHSSGKEQKTLPFVQHPAYRFLHGISASFFPLLRRHYLDTEGKEILSSCLHTFVALKQVSDIIDGDGEERKRGEKTAFRVCGVSLAQAAEVAFFLSMQRFDQSRSDSGLGGAADSIDNPVVLSYVKEVLFALDHNTAKQLWHLRVKNLQQGFTGMDCEIESPDERRQRRQAQSILSVVHAHVMHPSFLWMPLQQLQEVVFILSQNRELLEGLQHDSKPMGDACDPPPITVVRVGSLGGTPWHFGRALGYMVMRLYVVSNVLRHYHHALRGEERPSHVLLEEPAMEAKKRERRAWAKNMAHTLLDSCTGIAAEVEGLNPKRMAHRRRGNMRVLARLEATVRLASRHGLLFHVRNRGKMRRLRQAAQRNAQSIQCGVVADAAGAVDDGDAAGAAHPSGSLIIRLNRADASMPLGFSLNGDSATIRRLTRAEIKGSADKLADTTPFATALRAAGVADPHTMIGWRVVDIDGANVESSKAVILLVKGKCEFSMTLSPT